jgi:hypothetical protein
MHQIDQKGEERERKRLRADHNLRVVRGVETDSSAQELPNDVFGYEEIFAVQGLMDGRARVKPARDTYPLEVHKVDGAVYLIGFVSEVDCEILDHNLDGSVILWMRRQKDATVLARVPLARVEAEESRGDGTTTNPFRLVLELRAHRLTVWAGITPNPHITAAMHSP